MRLDHPSVALRRTKFVKEYVKTLSPTEAMTKAYPNMKRTTATAHANKMLQRPDVKLELKAVLEQQGLTLPALVEQSKGMLTQAKEQLPEQKITPELYYKMLDGFIKLSVEDRLKVQTSLNINLDYTTTPELLTQRDRYASFFNSIVEGETVSQPTHGESQPPIHPKTKIKKYSKAPK